MNALTTNTAPEFLLLQEGAVFARVSVRTMKRWFLEGLPSYQPVPKGRVLLRRCELEQFITRRSCPQPALDRLVEDVMGELMSGRQRRNGNGNRDR